MECETPGGGWVHFVGGGSLEGIELPGFICVVGTEGQTAYVSNLGLQCKHRKLWHI